MNNISPFILTLIIGVIHIAESKDCDNYHWCYEVLSATATCSSTRLQQFDDDFDAKDMADVGVAIASNVVPHGWFILTTYNLIWDLQSSNEWSTALEELWNDLIQCMDSRMDDYRLSNDEEHYYFEFVNFEEAIESHNAGDYTTFQTLDNGVNDAFLNVRTHINNDFKNKGESEYLSDEASLPLSKTAAEMFWLIATTDLALEKEYIDENPNNIYYTTGSYNAVVSDTQDKICGLKDWVHTATENIYSMYKPTVWTTTSYDLELWGTYYNFKWYMSWENGAITTDSSDIEYGNNWDGYTEDCYYDTCCQSHFEDEFEEWFSENITPYVTLFDELCNKALMIGDYGDPSYWQATAMDEWLNFGTDGTSSNIAHYTDIDFEDVILTCDNDDSCVGFSWNEDSRKAYTKEGDFVSLKVSEGSGWVSILKDTTKFPIMFKSVNNNECLDHDLDDERAVTYQCQSGSNQYWIYNRETGEIASEYDISPYDNKCLEARESDTLMVMKTCDNGDNQKWMYDPNTKLIRSLWEEHIGKCVSKDSDRWMHLKDCNSEDTIQQWGYTDGTTTAANVNTFILSGLLIGVISLCILIGICMKGIVGLNKKQMDVKYKVVDVSDEEESIIS